MAIEIHTLRTVIRTRAPIFNSRTRIVEHCARASFVPASPNSRNAYIKQYAIEEKYKRT